MGANTKIEWTATHMPDGTVIPGYTFNPWLGCTKVSHGCTHCYAETLMDRRWDKVQWGPQGERIRTKPTYWQQPRKWNKKAEEQGIRMKVFCGSLCDVFEDKPNQHEQLNAWRQRLFEVIDSTPHLDWLLLTKRPENIRRLWPFGWYDGQFTWPNVWIGTSVENQEAADARIPELLKIPAVVRFLSCEPLLGPIDLRIWLRDERDRWQADDLQWIIVGGESGPRARPMHPDWARRIRDHCQKAHVPYFFKQWGEYIPRSLLTQGELANLPNSTYVNAVPIDGDQVYRVGKKTAGRLLDGVEWSEFPKVKVTA